MLLSHRGGDLGPCAFTEEMGLASVPTDLKRDSLDRSQVDGG